MDTASAPPNIISVHLPTSYWLHQTVPIWNRLCDPGPANVCPLKSLSNEPSFPRRRPPIQCTEWEKTFGGLILFRDIREIHHWVALSARTGSLYQRSQARTHQAVIYLLFKLCVPARIYQTNHQKLQLRKALWTSTDFVGARRQLSLRLTISGDLTPLSALPTNSTPTEDVVKWSTQELSWLQFGHEQR